MKPAWEPTLTPDEIDTYIEQQMAKKPRNPSPFSRMQPTEIAPIVLQHVRNRE